MIRGWEFHQHLSKHSRFYRPELDILRAVAFCLVFLHHTTFQLFPFMQVFRSAGAFGVCLFFLLSAFLITELLEKEHQSTGTIRLRAFYARRVLRIWPLYFAILFLDFGFSRIFHPGTFTFGHLAAFLLLAGNWFVARHGFLWSWSMPLWSISVEEQFYLLCPSTRRFTGRSGLLAFSSTALAVSCIALVVLSRWSVNVDTYVWVNSFVQFQFFASGVLLALLLRGRTPNLRTGHRGLLVLSGLAAFYTAQAVFHTKISVVPAELHMLLPGYILVNFGCLALLLGFLGANIPARANSLTYLGKISYGLYAFHYGLLEFSGYAVRAFTKIFTGLRPYSPSLRDVLAFVLTVFVASLSYRYFEAPILLFKRRFEVIRTRPA